MRAFNFICGKYSIIFISLFLLLYGCGGPDTGNVFSLDDYEIEGVSAELYETDKIFGGIRDLEVIDDYVVLNAPDDKGMLLFFKKDGFEYSHTGGIVGRGPTEYTSHKFEVSLSNDSCLVYSSMGNSVARVYTKDNFINSGPYARESRLPSASNTCLYAGSQFIANSTLRSRFYIVDDDGEIVYEYDQYPHARDKEKFEEWIRDYNVKAHPTEPRFVSFLNIPKTIEIFNVYGDSIGREACKTYGDTLLMKQMSDEGFDHLSRIRGFSDLYCTSGYIYATYSEFTVQESAEKDNGPKYLFVFDWDANVKKVYHVSQNMRKIAVEPDDSKVWFSTLNEDGVDVVGSFNL